MFLFSLSQINIIVDSIQFELTLYNTINTIYRCDETDVFDVARKNMAIVACRSIEINYVSNQIMPMKVVIMVQNHFLRHESIKNYYYYWN